MSHLKEYVKTQESKCWSFKNLKSCYTDILIPNSWNITLTILQIFFWKKTMMCIEASTNWIGIWINHIWTEIHQTRNLFLVYLEGNGSDWSKLNYNFFILHIQAKVIQMDLIMAINWISSFQMYASYFLVNETELSLIAIYAWYTLFR